MAINWGGEIGNRKAFNNSRRLDSSAQARNEANHSSPSLSLSRPDLILVLIEMLMTPTREQKHKKKRNRHLN